MSKKVRGLDKRNAKHGYAKNRKMNDDTYALRRQVMDIIYEAKNHVTLPRIEVRITEKDIHALGWAYLNECVIYIPMQLFTCKARNKYFKGVVLHEIVHAVTGFEHDEKCPLMRPCVGSAPLTEDEMWSAFEKYFK